MNLRQVSSVQSIVRPAAGGRPGRLCAWGIVLAVWLVPGCRQIEEPRVQPEPVPERTAQPIRVSFPRSRPAAPVPTAAPSLPEPAPTPSHWAEQSENFVAGAVPGENHWTFAVLAPNPQRDRGMQTFRRCLETALAMGPRFVVVIAEIGTTPDARFRVGDKRLDFGPDTVPVPLFLFPGEVPAARPHLAVECAPYARLLFVQSELLFGSRGSGPAEQERQWLGEQLASLPPQRALLVCLTRMPAGRDRVREVELLQQLLADAPGPAAVIGPDAERYCWWRSGKQQFIGIAPAAPEPVGGGVEQDGAFPAALWVHLASPEPVFRVLRPDRLLPPTAFSLDGQQQRRRLQRSLAASPIDPHNPFSTIKLKNETSQSLQFRAHWEFTRQDVTVDPQILGFRLEPGEVFQQKFRFGATDAIPLKFAAPKLVLHVDDAGDLARPQEWRLEAVLCCRMAGRIVTFAEPPVLDGHTDEWPGSPVQIDHTSQVVQGLEYWRGPNDVSGNFRAGIDAQCLYLAACLHDDCPEPRSDTAHPRVVFYVHRQPDSPAKRDPWESTPGPDEAAPPMRIEVLANGRHRVFGAPANASPVAVRMARSENGVEVEAAVPLALLPGGADRRRFLLDAAIRDSDPDEPVAKWLFYSGNRDNNRSAEYLAIFTRTRKVSAQNE